MEKFMRNTDLCTLDEAPDESKFLEDTEAAQTLAKQLKYANEEL